MRVRRVAARLWLFLSFASTSITAGALLAAEPSVPDHAVVAGFERFGSTASAGDLVRQGELLLEELGCVACHRTESSRPLVSKPAPVLDDVGARVRVDFIRALLNDPQHAKPGTTMPDLFAKIPAARRQQQIEALVHFLASTGNLTESSPISAGVKRGEELFHSVGCVACHDPQGKRALPERLATSIPLPNLPQKYSVPSLARFLENPHAVRPGGRMPALNLTAEEARDVACFLLRDLDVPASLTFAYYEGSWEKLPDFSQLSVKDEGAAASFDVNVGKSDHFAVRFQGQLHIERAGEYRFHLGCDDGARLTIDGEPVVVHDGIHAMSFETGRRRLESGEHALVVEYFEQAGEQELRVEFEGPGVKRQSLEFALVVPGASATRFEVDQALAQRGRELFESVGCAACHRMRRNDEQLANHRPAKTLAELEPDRGCLADDSPLGVPAYALSAPQRNALQAALKAQPATHRRGDSWQQTLVRFNCLACHEREGIGGVESGRQAFFRSNQPEMGDEGRVPPTLTKVGDKLNEQWTQQVLQKGAKDRPYMLTRMPRFAIETVEQLAGHFATADQTTTAGAEPDEPLRKLKSTGRLLVGDKGLSCIKCHTWGNVKATGIQAISLTTMAQRLRQPWFEAYLLDPQRFRPGTRMPAAWPNGQAALPAILDGQASRQIHAIWRFLEDGRSANMPPGLVADPIELTPGETPVIYRNFLEGVSPRAIAVGYPEHVSLAFDAQRCTVVLLWQGAFIDASMHWLGRGQGFQRPLGDNLLRLPAGPPFALWEQETTEWPSEARADDDYHFRGYRLDERGRPTFLYQWRDVSIADEPQPHVTGDHYSLRRVIRLNRSPSKTAAFRAAVAENIESTGDGWYRIQGDWRMRLTATGSAPIFRSSQGKQELIVPIPAAGIENAPLIIEQEIEW